MPAQPPPAAGAPAAAAGAAGRTATLPERIPAAQAAAQRQRFVGQLSAAQLPRLAEATLPPDGAPLVLAVALAIAPEPETYGRVRGTLDGTVWLPCQRCLEPARFALHAACDWTLVADEAGEERWLDTRDPVLLDAEGGLALHERIEDEALLALPIVPLHPEGECPALAGAVAPDAELPQNRRPAEALNPFAALKERLKPR